MRPGADKPSTYRLTRAQRLFWMAAALAGFAILLAGVFASRTTLFVGAFSSLAGLMALKHFLVDRETRRLAAQRETARQESERRALYLNALVEHAPLAIVALDPDHRVKVCNPAFEKLFKYHQDEVVGKHLDELITNRDTLPEARNITERVQNGEAVHDTLRRCRRDGTPLTVELTGLPMTEDGEVVGIFAVYQDITDRIEAMTALRESEARYRTLVEHAPEAIVIFDLDTGRFVDCNQEASQLFGLTRRKLLGCSPSELSPRTQPDGRESIARSRHWLEKARGGEQPIFEWVHRSAEGEDIHCEVRLTKLPSGGRTLIRGSILDIRERLNLQKQLRQAQRMEAVGQLAGGVAHDFNNLLTVISGYCDLAIMRPGSSEETRNDLNEIRRAGERASALTRQLLAFSRRQVMEPEEVDLNEVVLEMEDMLNRLVGENIALTTSLELTLERVHIDPGQVEQVIANLVVNARDALPEGGVIRLETRNEQIERSPLDADQLQPGAYAVLEITDTGTGMDDTTLAHIFEPFFTTKERGKGTGLGLSTVYGIVTQSGGTIEANSVLGQGTTFRIYFPALTPTADAAAPPESRVMVKGSELILVVEDEEMVRNLTRSVLEEAGYRVLTASNGDEALELALRHGDSIHLILADVILPGAGGPEIVERARPLVPGLRVLFMSGYAEDLISHQGTDFDMPQFLQKPFTPTELVTKVREILDGEARAAG